MYRLQSETRLELIVFSMEYYGPRYKLEVLANNQDNHNPPEYLESIK
jgi:hypothetical protein